MSKEDHHGERELAAFIRAGATRRPEQAYGDYFKGKFASCALGAAYEGMYRLPENVEGTRPTKDLEWFFDVLEGTIRTCPYRGMQKKAGAVGAHRAHQRRPPLVTRADRHVARIGQRQSQWHYRHYWRNAADGCTFVARTLGR